MGENHSVEPADVFAQHLEAKIRRRVTTSLIFVRGDIKWKAGCGGFWDLARNSGGYSFADDGHAFATCRCREK